MHNILSLHNKFNKLFLVYILILYSDGFLNIEEFDGICKGLFRNDRGIVYSLDVHTLEHIFNIFDTKKVEANSVNFLNTNYLIIIIIF